MQRKYLLILGLFFTGMAAVAQVDKNTDLYKQIMANDSLLFTIGFNTCAITEFEKLLSDDFEFIHDKDSISDKKQFIRGLRNGLCGSPGEYRSRRELITATIKIYPLFKAEVLYGAIQMGDHRFHETLKGKPEQAVGTAKYTHVWLLEDGNWKLAKSLSFDHQAMP